MVKNFVGALGVLTTVFTVHQALGRTMYAVHLDLAPLAVAKRPQRALVRFLDKLLLLFSDVVIKLRLQTIEGGTYP